MATSTKKRPAKKAAAKKAPATKKSAAERAAAAKAREQKKAEVEARRHERAERDADLTERIVKLRSTEPPTKWAEIADTLNISQGKAQTLHMLHEGRDEKAGEPTPAKVQRDRDQGNMSWPAIMAKYGITKAKVQKLYREAGGDPHASYIGHGGRYYGHETKVAKQKAALASERKTKPSSQRSKNARPVFKGDETADVIISKIDGKKIAHRTSGGGVTKPIPVKPKTVKVGKTKAGKRVVQFANGKTGGAHTIAVEDIVKVS
jgi:hypothetical protein